MVNVFAPLSTHDDSLPPAKFGVYFFVWAEQNNPWSDRTMTWITSYKLLQLIPDDVNGREMKKRMKTKFTCVGINVQKRSLSVKGSRDNYNIDEYLDFDTS